MINAGVEALGIRGRSRHEGGIIPANEIYEQQTAWVSETILWCEAKVQQAGTTPKIADQSSILPRCNPEHRLGHGRTSVPSWSSWFV